MGEGDLPHLKISFGLPSQTDFTKIVSTQQINSEEGKERKKKNRLIQANSYSKYTQ